MLPQVEWAGDWATGLPRVARSAASRCCASRGLRAVRVLCGHRAARAWCSRPLRARLALLPQGRRRAPPARRARLYVQIAPRAQQTPRGWLASWPSARTHFAATPRRSSERRQPPSGHRTALFKFLAALGPRSAANKVADYLSHGEELGILAASGDNPGRRREGPRATASAPAARWATRRDRQSATSRQRAES